MLSFSFGLCVLIIVILFIFICDLLIITYIGLAL